VIHEVLHDMFSLPVPLLEKVLRTLVVYLFLVVVLRLAGKRELGQFNRFDLVVLLTLSNTLQNAIIGNDNSVVGGLIGAAVLIGFNDIAARIEFAHRWFSRLVEGRATVLIEDGRVLSRNMAKEHLTEAELLASCHRQGVTRFQDVERATLETSGAISVILRTPTRDEVMLASISERLERVEALLRERPPAAAQA
jgi:uncharacterized membrane protein YcaP (DUF421 family)